MSQCNAKSSRSGKRCRAPAIRGGSVCQAHGGSAPQVRHAAAARVAHLVDSAITGLEKALKSKNEAIALRAVQDILDRNNMKGDAFIRLLNPDAGQPAGLQLSEEMLARMEALPPDELFVLLRVLGLIAAPSPVDIAGPSQLTQ
jgi:hypothetical protein